MTQEEKELLLKDLCARLPYGVFVEYDYGDGVKRVTKFHGNYLYLMMLGKLQWKDFKPYLRPMSSITDEEKEHLQSLHNIISDENYEDGYSPAAWDAISEFNDYCNAHHLDNRGLIGKGLALEAPEHMYD